MINPSKNTAALLLLIQVCVPVSGSFLSIANASEINNKRWINSEENIKQLHHIQNNLPELGHDNSDKTENENEPFIAEKSSQLGSILSDENSSDAAKSYATGVASSAINQEINNWLNQVGHARVQLSTDKSGNADFLYPLLDQKTHMIFSQTGVRINTDRTIANIGLGYRQFSDNWMWGINSFYDYDITGSNKRMGIGTELGADYIKLSANGYIRLSNWRGSSLNDWSDFDERPANGFDVRLESYLPSHPQLGANLKYEQYFGEGINLNNGSSENDLNNDPKIYNIGLSYTPVPLVTIKANHAMGNINETSGTLEFNYHLGVPFNQQIDPGYVSTMRTLAASRYDFVDRNYDIVMQFKKQTLLTISLPDELLVQPKQRQSLKATITLSKYGVKDIQWSAPALIAAGGHFNQTSLNTIDVTLPAIHGNQQTYDVTAIATDNNGNQSNTATTRLVVTPMDGIISSFVVTPGTQVIANNTDSFDAVVTITDSAGNALENTAVEFSLSGFSPLSAFTLIGNNTSVHSPLTLSTNNRGLAVIKVKGKKVQKGLLIARLEDGTQASAPLHFVADSTTAQIDASDLAVIDNNALADSKSVNRVRVRVTDAAGNPLANETITVTADNGATIGSIVPTGPDGETSFTLTNNNAGDSSVTVTINGSTQKITVTFLPDSKTAHIDQANINIVKNNAIANGTDTSRVKVIVTDAQGNPLAGQTITADAGADVTVSTISATNAAGETEFTLTSLKAGPFTVTATINGSSQSVTVTFVADENTAQIAQNAVSVEKNNALADGTDTDRVKVIVTDAQGNPLAGQTITADAGADVTVSTISATNAAGETEFTLTSLKAGPFTVTATINGSSQDVIVTFIADNNTAHIAQNAVSVEKNNALADGTDTDRVKVIVTDAQGNPLAGQTITADAGTDVTVGTITATNAAGETEFTLTSLKAGPFTVTATINGSSQSVTVTFVADENTAQIAQNAVTVEKNNALADGTDTDRVKVIVTDAQGNPLAGQTITADAGTDVTVGTITATNAAGETEFTLTSLKAGPFTVTATINGSSQSVTVTFIADNNTAHIAQNAVTVEKNNALADGTDTDRVKVIVTDAQGNPLAGQTITADAGTDVTVGTITATNAAGETEFTLTSLKAGPFTVTATINGSSQSVTVTFVADENTAQIAQNAVSVEKNNALADGTDTDRVKVIVTDAQGNPLAGQTITADAGTDVTVGTITATNAAGETEFTLTSLKAGPFTVTATINGSSQDVIVTFIADNNTAQNAVSVEKNNALADGTDTDRVKVIVTDAQGNPLAGQTITADAGTDVTVGTITATNAAGETEFTLTSLKAGPFTVTATINGSSQNVTVTFIADNNTAHIAQNAVSVEKNNALADGTDTDRVKVIVTDAQGNPLAGQTITADAGTDVTVGTITATNAAGETEFTLTSLKAGPFTVTATINGSSQSVTVTFVADENTAQNAVSVEKNNALADGTDTDRVKVIVTDAKGNPLAGQTITADAGADVTVGTIAATNAAGETEFTLTSLKAGPFTVTATINGSSQSVTVTFVADENTAHIAQNAVSVEKNNALADGTDTDRVKVIVTDAQGNPLAGQTITANAGTDVTVGTITATNAAGETEFTLTSLKAGPFTVTATINGSSQSVTVTFVADENTAQIAQNAVSVEKNNALADGTDTDRVKVVVTDAQGNPLAGQTITADAGTDVTVGTITATNAAGETEFTLTSLKAGPFTVTATINGSSQSVTVTFVADENTAHIAQNAVTVEKNNALADGTDTDRVKVIVTDAQGNPLAGQTITANAGTDVTVGTITATNAAGETEFTLTSLKAGPFTVTATINGSSQSVTVTFVADENTAHIAQNAVSVEKNNALADGTDTDRVKVIVTDAQGNPLAGQTITADAGTDVTVGTITATNAAGETEFTLTSLKAGPFTVTATINGSSQSVTVTFVADENTAHIAQNAISVEKNDSIADGITANKVKVRVTDANNNPVKGILINATASNGAIPGEIAETDINGETILTLTNKTVGESLVTATLGSSSSQIIITFTSPIDIANSAAVWNKTKILNSSGFDEDGKAIINIKLRDKDNNPVTGIAGDIKPTSSDNKLIISDITETTPGQYAATVTSADIGKHHITVTFAYLNDSIQTPDLDVYTYTFRLDDPNHKIGVTALYEYHLYAKASDGSGSETELDVNLANWTSSNPGIAKIIPPATIQGVREGTTEIRVNSSGKTGYKGIAITADPVTLTVTGLRFSQTFGDSTSKPGSASEYLIAPPDYTLSAHGAWVVDSIGNSGGTGGQTTMITNTNTVTSISVVTCEFENVNVIGKLVFKKPLGNQSIGEANSTCKNKSTFEYVIKTGEQFIGFTGWDSQTAALNKVYLSGIKFITIEK